nr:crk-like protein [Halisarca dujardinii]
MSYKEQSWYHGPVDRVQAESVLHGRKAGLFLVRDSSTHHGDFVLSVSENTKVSHYIITHRNNMYLIGDQSFPDLPAVLDFYRVHYLDTTTLVEIAPRPPHMPQQQGFPPPLTLSAPGQPQPQPRLGEGSRDLLVKGKFDFKSDDPEDLNFKKGDMMKVLREDEDDWWYARHSDGRQGSIPVPYVEVVPAALLQEPQGQVLARATMERQCIFDPSALSFSQGDIIKVTKRNDNGIWEGESNGRKGHFPFTSVELISS